MTKYLSKSGYLAGLNCPRKLWLRLWRPELQAEPAGMTALIMEQGLLFGELAHRLFADAVKIDNDLRDPARAEANTQAAIEAGAGTILEAAFRAGQYRVLSDAVQREADGSWHLIEVKSSTGVKPEHIPDLAYQRYVIEQAGYPVSSCSVLHASRKGRAPDLHSLFNAVDVTHEVAAYLPSVEVDLARLAPLLQKDAAIPALEFKKVCVGCDFQAHCWAGIDAPTIYESIDIRHIAMLEARGIFYIDDIPADLDLPAPVQRMVDRMQQRRVDIDAGPVRQMLAELQYPLYFLDFESVAIATPLFEDSAPWQKYAFQYSLHIKNAGGGLRHVDFLHDRRSDPGEALSRSLLEHIGETGSVIVYNKTMEKGVLHELARQFPDRAGRLRHIASRIWDLEVVFRKYYRHWQWANKSSIKYVLPTLVAELSYDDLEVQEGGTASLEWLRMTASANAAERARKANALKRYCERDTLAMVRLLEVVEQEVGKVN